jgi:hypothetical protein
VVSTDDASIDIYEFLFHKYSYKNTSSSSGKLSEGCMALPADSLAWNVDSVLPRPVKRSVY